MTPVKNYIIGISGFSKTGKDELAFPIIKDYEAIEYGLVDTPRRHMKEIYGFTNEQVFGSLKDMGDIRYPKESYRKLGVRKWSEEDSKSHGLPFADYKNRYLCVSTDEEFWDNIQFKNQSYDIWSLDTIHNSKLFVINEGDLNFWLSPREVLQNHCTNIQDMYEPIWTESLIRFNSEYISRLNYDDKTFEKPVHFSILEYNKYDGYVEGPKFHNNGVVVTVCPSIRHKHEISILRKNAQKYNYIPVIISVKRPSIYHPNYVHRTEMEQASIDDGVFDFIVNNDSTLESLYSKSRDIMNMILGGTFSPKIDILP